MLQIIYHFLSKTGTSVYNQIMYKSRLIQRGRYPEVHKRKLTSLIEKKEGLLDGGGKKGRLK